MKINEDIERALAEQAEISTEDEDDGEAEEGSQLQEAIRLSKMDSQAEQVEMSTKDEDEEDSQLQEAIRISKMKSPQATSSLKQKTEEDLLWDTKAARASSSVGFAMSYPNGGLRITRTPGRLLSSTKNCVNLEDVISKKNLLSACVFSFFIAEEELFQHLPLSHSSDIPIYIGRDANMDPLVPTACEKVSIAMNPNGKLSKKQLENIRPKLDQLYKKSYGKNYHSFYAWSSGSSHSKILVLVYPGFLRVVITSCNMMDTDTVLGDNHWFIHDLPKLGSAAKITKTTQFEAQLLAHLEALGTPDEFVNFIRGKYDYSSVGVQLVTSVPGTFSGPKAEQHGILRLRQVVINLGLKLAEKQLTEELRLEVCAASIGNLNAKWLDGFYKCALGKEKIRVAATDCDVPDLKLFYPTVQDVKSAEKSAQEASSNIGCHTRPWEKAPDAVKQIFHHYESKDRGRLFHQKLIFTYNPKDKRALPYYVYVGSANLSQSAWGALEVDKKSNAATCDVKLVKMSNFECGVVVPGHLIETLLEPGTKSWQDGIIPYVQTARKYDLRKDRPWNDPRWVAGY